MNKPGLTRGIPMGILGYLLGMLITAFIRALQGLDPVWGSEAALVVTPFTTTWLFLWGMGAFNPKMSEHAHGPEHAEGAIVPAEEHAHAEEPASPLSLLTSQIWVVSTLAVLVVFALFAFALLPTGLRLDVTADAEASVSGFAQDVTMLLPLGVGTIQASQLGFFLGFIVFMLFSLFAVAGLLGLLFYALNQGVSEVKGVDPTPEMKRPPAPVRFFGRIFSGIANGLRRGLPRFLGQK